MKDHTGRMHEDADNKAGCRATSQMKSRAFFHPEMPRQASLREEICRELNRAAEARAHHGSPNTPVQSTDPFVAVDLSQPVIRIAVLVLRADREERRVRLEPRLD